MCSDICCWRIVKKSTNFNCFLWIVNIQVKITWCRWQHVQLVFTEKANIFGLVICWFSSCTDDMFLIFSNIWKNTAIPLHKYATLSEVLKSVIKRHSRQTLNNNLIIFEIFILIFSSFHHYYIYIIIINPFLHKYPNERRLSWTILLKFFNKIIYKCIFD